MSAPDGKRFLFADRTFDDRATYAAAVGALLAIGAAIRLFRIDHTSLWLDELAQVTVAQTDWAGFLGGVRSHTAAAPLDYLGTKLVLAALGFATATARLWPFLVGTATVLLVERLTTELTGSRRAALAAASLTVVSAFLIFYSQEARFYALAAATSVAAVWTFSRAERRGRPHDWAVFGLVSIAAVYTHYFYALLYAVMGLWFGLNRVGAWYRRRPGRSIGDLLRRLAPFLVLTAAVALAFVPWYLYAGRFHLALVYDYPPIPDLTLERAVRTLLVLFSGASRSDAEGTDAPTDWLLLVGILAFALVGAVRLVQRRPVIGGAVITFVLMLIPAVWIADQRARYFVSERQFIMLVPLVLVLAGTGIAHAMTSLPDLIGRLAPSGGAGKTARIGSRVVWAFLLVALVAASGVSLRRMWAGEFRPREDWRAASAFVVAAACPGGRIYSNVGPGYGYGVGTYEPELLDRLAYLQENNQNEFIVDVVKRYPITLRDTLVIFRDRPGVFVAGRGTIDTLSDYLAGLHLNYRTFTPRIRVFFPFGGCPA